MFRQESKYRKHLPSFEPDLLLKISAMITVWMLYVTISGIFHIAHICLGMSIASMALLMSEKNWTAKSLIALTLNMVAMGLSFWLLIR